MAQATIKIEGMTCMHCVMRVKKAIDGMKGVQDSKVDITSAVVDFDDATVKTADIEAAITKAGYKVVQ